MHIYWEVGIPSDVELHCARNWHRGFELDVIRFELFDIEVHPHVDSLSLSVVIVYRCLFFHHCLQLITGLDKILHFPYHFIQTLLLELIGSKNLNLMS